MSVIVLALAVLVGPTCFTSTRHVREILPGADGGVRIATTGGWLLVTPDGSVQKITEREGLASHDLPTVGAKPLPAVWEGHEVGLPPSLGTHPVGSVTTSDGVVVAMYGDHALWRWDGKGWTSGSELPAEVDDPTSLRKIGADLWVGTRRHGAWRYRDGAWRGFLGTDEPYDHNAQAMVEYDGSLWVSTLEDGLQSYDGTRWERTPPGELSTPAPRDLVVFRESLYVRHGDGQVDAYDGKAWRRNLAWGELPRKQATRLAADERRLVVGQWGGWSEFDGQRWTHRFPAELSGAPVTALAIDGPRLWIGTQGKGLFRVDEKVTRYGDASGLPDDWITSLALVHGRVIVGTFVGGAAVREGERWRNVPGTAGAAVTGIVANGDQTWIATGRGVHLLGGGWSKPSEAQALAWYRGHLWVGGRRGIYRLAVGEQGHRR
jgi:ligand-binding sensor domain-containing protein